MRDILTVKNALLLSLALVITAIFGGYALDAEGSIPTSETIAAEKAVRQVVNGFFEAAERGDWDVAAAYMSEDFVLYSDQATVFSKQEYVDLLESEDLAVESMSLRDLELRVSETGEMAWCKYRGFFDHGTMKVETVETLIFARRLGTWKITHAHASVKVLGEGAGAES